MLNRNRILSAVISGIMLVLSFPPFDLWYLAWIALVPLMSSVSSQGRRGALLTGIFTGFVYFAGTVYWVSHSMYIYGKVPVPLTIIAVIMLCLYLSLYVGLFSWLFTVIRNRTSLPPALFAPPLWVALELLRTYALTGFPWSSLGYSQYSVLHLIQVSDITGIYGISFLIVVFNSIIFQLTGYIVNPADTPRVPRRAPYLSAFYVILLLAVSITYGTARLNEQDTGRMIRVGIVQGNIPQDQKWDRRFQDDVINKYMTMTTGMTGQRPDLVIWPETALPFVFGHDTGLTSKIIDFQKNLDSYMMFGSVRVLETENKTRQLANSVILMSPEGQVMSVYDKIHLVPYGEYVPLRKFFPFIEKLVTAIGDFMPGSKIVVMQTPSVKIGSLICYEIIFPGLARKFVHDGAEMLVTVTNDAWFGRTSAPYQHFSMAVFRAVENRVPVVRAANTGISGFIDSSGRILKKSGIFEETAITENIRTGRGNSFYSKYGDIFAYACSIFVLLVVMRCALLRKY